MAGPITRAGRTGPARRGSAPPAGRPCRRRSGPGPGRPVVAMWKASWTTPGKLVGARDQVVVLRHRLAAADRRPIPGTRRGRPDAGDLAGDGDHRHRVHEAVARPVIRFSAPGPEVGEDDRRPAAGAGIAVGHVRGALLVPDQDVVERRVARAGAGRCGRLAPPGYPKMNVDPFALRAPPGSCSLRSTLPLPR